MANLLGSGILAVGLLVLLHAVFSGMHYKSLVSDLYGADSPLHHRLPADVRFPARLPFRGPRPFSPPSPPVSGTSSPATLALLRPSPAPAPARPTQPNKKTQVPLECAASFILCLLGCLLLSDGFKPINSAEEHPLNSIHRLFGPRLDTRRSLAPAKAEGASS